MTASPMERGSLGGFGGVWGGLGVWGFGGLGVWGFGGLGVWGFGGLGVWGFGGLGGREGKAWGFSGGEGGSGSEGFPIFGFVLGCGGGGLGFGVLV